MAPEDDPSGPPPAIDLDLDATGERCPLPVLRAKKRIKPLAAGAVMRLTSDDPVAPIDVANWCREDGHALIAREDAASGWHFYIRKA